MPQINISDLTFAYEGSCENIFENVSLKIDTGWRLGFVARNGKGKTTFLNLLSGKLKNYRGKIKSEVDFEYFPFEVKDKRVNTIEVVENICPGYEFWKLVCELNFLKADSEILYRAFESLSKGEQTKVLLASLFLKDDRFLLIDEPTNHLDILGRQIVGDYLNSKKGFILVSHDRWVLDNCTDHILSLNRTNIEIQRGNYSSWLKNKEMRDNFEICENEKLKKEIARLNMSGERTSKWADGAERTKYGSKNSGLRPDRGYLGHKSAKMMKRAKSIEKRRLLAAEKKSELMKNVEVCEDLKIPQIKYRSDLLVRFDKFSLFYGERCVLRNLSFTINQGDRIALIGPNGSGKSSIVKIMDGENVKHEGMFQKNRDLKISFVFQNSGNLSGNLREYIMANNINEGLFKAILRKLDFSREQFEKDMANYSDGQKKKVLIAKSLCEPAHLYVWDEPLNFIDVISRMQIENLLLRFKPTILFIEHDRTFTDKTATKTVYIEN